MGSCYLSRFFYKIKTLLLGFLHASLAFPSLFLLQSISILAIVIHPHFLMGSCHLSSIVLQNQTIIVGFPTCKPRVSKFVFVVIHFHPRHRYSSSLPNGFLTFVEYCSTKSNHYCWVSYMQASRFQVCPYCNPFPSSPSLVILTS